MDELAAGRAALDAGDWASARRAFERALAIEETPEGLEGAHARSGRISSS